MIADTLSPLCFAVHALNLCDYEGEGENKRCFLQVVSRECLGNYR